MKSLNMLRPRVKNQRYVVVFCVKEGNSYNFFKFVSIKPNAKTIKYDKEHQYVIDIENHTYRKGNTRYYCIDINAKQINFENLEEEDSVSSRINAMIMSENIIEQLAKATTKPIEHKFDYLALFIGLIMGVLGGIIAGIFIPFPIA